jgi:hypothetical protein
MLYTFGDSFIKMFNTPEWAYTSLIAKEFNTTEKSFGLISSSLEYTFHQFEQQRNNFVEGDIVIIALSLLDKTFFFNDRPALSHLWSFETETHTTEEKLAMEMYYKHLHNTDNSKINLLNFLHSVQEITRSKKLKTVIIKTLFFDNNNIVNKERYPELIIANDCFWELMKLEISNESLLSYLNLNKFANDSRVFHFSEPNHRIIADSIISAIKNNTEINLENVLLRNIYNWDIYNQSRP